MSSGGLKRTAACRRVMPLSSEHDDIALAMFRNEAGLERTDDRKVFQSWTMMSSTMSPMELNMVDLQDVHIIIYAVLCSGVLFRLFPKYRFKKI
jgi:hypothetical protein